MSSILRPTLHKIPGGGMPLAKKESYAKDLTKMTWSELLEIKEREEKLLNNRSKMQKLPDKGKRMQDFFDKVMQEMERRSNVDEAAKIFSNLNIASDGEKRLNELEWQGNLKKLGDMDPLEDVLDSDDETDMDPLKIIAQRQMHERKVKVEQPEVNLITNSDLKEIESFKTDCGIFDKTVDVHPNSDSPGDGNVTSIDLMPKLLNRNEAANSENIARIDIIAQRQIHERKVKVEQPEVNLITNSDLQEIESFKTDCGIFDKTVDVHPNSDSHGDGNVTFIDLMPKLLNRNEAANSENIARIDIIAQRQMHERKVKVEQPEVNLITNSDLKEIESFKTDCGIFDKTVDVHPNSDSPGDGNVTFIDLMPKLLNRNEAANSENIARIDIIAQRQMHERKVKVEQPEVNLITNSDLKEIESFKTDCGIFDKTVDVHPNSDSPGDGNVTSIDLMPKLLNRNEAANSENIARIDIIAQRQMHERKVKVEQPEVNLITNSDLQEIESFKTDCAIFDKTVDVHPNSDSPGDGNVTSIDLMPKLLNRNEDANSENIASIDCIGKLLKNVEPRECAAISTEITNFIDANIASIGLTKKVNINNPNLNKFTYSPNRVDNECSSSRSSPHTLDLEPHVHYLVDKTETNVHQPAREKYKPFRTTVSNVHDPIKERQRKRNKYWEITAATPPPIQHNEAQLLSLIDSVEIQTQYLSKLKELQEKQAAERLAAKLKRLENRKIVLPSEEELKTKTSFTKYRNTQNQINNIEGECKFNEDDEVHDPLDEEKFGGVNYTVYE